LETSSPSEGSNDSPTGPEDALLDLFRHKSQIPIDAFLEQMREQRQTMDLK
jgi:hypothetical protein